MEAKALEEIDTEEVDVDEVQIPMVDLNTEYSPSAWSQRFATRHEVVLEHIKFVTEETHRNRGKYKLTKNIRYGDGDRELMDVYFKDEEDNSIVVYIHGGYWQELTKDQSAYCVAPLVESGFRVVIVDYDLCPAVTIEQIIDEILRAFKSIFQYADSIGSKRICIVGHSAGAHLAASVLQQDKFSQINENQTDKLVSVFLISGIYDLTDLQKTLINKDNLLNLNEGNIKKCSPAFQSYQHLKGAKIKFNICVAEYDSPTFIKQSQDFHEYLKRNGNQTNFRFVPNCDHFDIVEKLSQEQFELTQKIIAQTMCKKLI